MKVISGPVFASLVLGLVATAEIVLPIGLQPVEIADVEAARKKEAEIPDEYFTNATAEIVPVWNGTHPIDIAIIEEAQREKEEEKPDLYFTNATAEIMPVWNGTYPIDVAIVEAQRKKEEAAQNAIEDSGRNATAETGSPWSELQPVAIKNIPPQEVTEEVKPFVPGRSWNLSCQAQINFYMRARRTCENTLIKSIGRRRFKALFTGPNSRVWLTEQELAFINTVNSQWPSTFFEDLCDQLHETYKYFQDCELRALRPLGESRFRALVKAIYSNLKPDN